MNAIQDAIAGVMEQMKVKDPEMYNVMKDKVQVVLDIGKTEEKKTPPNMIFEYVKERRNRVGVIVGINKDNTIKIGWSKCHSKLDVFNKEVGLSLAEARAVKIATAPKLPDCMRKQVMSFQNRCYRYFKNTRTMELVR